jgi:hypothetical protein
MGGPIEQEPIHLFNEKVTVHASHEVVMQVYDNISSIEGD